MKQYLHDPLTHTAQRRMTCCMLASYWSSEMCARMHACAMLMLQPWNARSDHSTQLVFLRLHLLALPTQVGV